MGFSRLPAGLQDTALWQDLAAREGAPNAQSHCALQRGNIRDKRSVQRMALQTGSQP
jgi:hypothetical protein